MPPARVRIELPRDASVIHVPGRISSVRRADGVHELEIVCAEGAEDRARRMDVRIDAECRLRIGVGTSDEQWEETRTVNLAAGGALVVSESRARVGETIEVELELSGEVIHCRAEVIRRGVKASGACPRTSAALKFIGLSDELRDRIALHVLQIHAREKVARRRG